MFTGLLVRTGDLYIVALAGNSGGRVLGVDLLLRQREDRDPRGAAVGLLCDRVVGSTSRCPL